MPEGLLSAHLVKGLEPGTIVRLALPKGDFVLPDPPPDRMLFLVAGSGVTPVMAMLRTLDRRGTMPDVVMHYSSPTAERMIFRKELKELADRHDSLTLHELHTDTDGMLELADLDDLCPDWKDRETWACGPAPMLDAIEEHFEAAGIEDQLHIERFSLALDGDGGEGGTLTFQNSSKTVEVDGATTVLEAGEEAGIGMPYGCRMGICHTCTHHQDRGHHARPAQRRGVRPAERTGADLRVRRRGRRDAQHLTDSSPTAHRRRHDPWPSQTSRSTPTSARRTSSSSAASWTPSAPRSRSPATATTRRTSTG